MLETIFFNNRCIGMNCRDYFKSINHSKHRLAATYKEADYEQNRKEKILITEE